MFAFNAAKRLSILFLSALLKGASVGPMIKLAIDVDSRFMSLQETSKQASMNDFRFEYSLLPSFTSILISAFVGIAIAFVCLSAATMLARRREYLYLGGLVASGLSILWWLQFVSSIFRGSSSLFKFEVNSNFKKERIVCFR